MSMPSPDLTGQIALVTGASRGIGAATAKALAKAGAHVVLLARTQGALEEIYDEIEATGGSASLIPMDLNRLVDIDKLGASLFERFGKLDILINAAGVLGTLTPAHHAQYKDIEKTMKLNFIVPTRLIQSMHSLLQASDDGRAIFLSGDIAEHPLAYWGMYAASKSALECWVRTYAAEVRQTNISAKILRLPPVQTAMLAEAFPGGFPGKTFSPEEAASKILEQL